MNKNKTLIAINLGTAYITAIAAEEQGNSGLLRILGAEHKTSNDIINYGIVEKASSAGYTVTECLKLLKNRIRIEEIDSIFVSYGGRSMQLVQVSAKRKCSQFVSEKLLEEMQTECEQKIINQGAAVFVTTPLLFKIDRTKITNHAPINEKAKEIEALYNIVCGKPIVLENTQRCIEQTPGYVIEYATLKSDALSAALLNEEELQEGTAIIDLGAGTTSIHIYKNCQLQKTFTVPMGGKAITKDISSVGISIINAEKLKCKKGKALQELVKNPIYIQLPANEITEPAVRIPTDFLAQIIEARLDVIMGKILLLLKDYETELPHGVVLTSGGAMLDGIIDYIQKYSKLPIRIGSHTEWLTEDSPDEFLAPEYSQLIGTLVMGAQYRKENVGKKLPEPKVKKTFIKKVGEKVGSMFVEFFGEE